MTDFLLLPTVQLKTGEQGRETEKMVSSCCIALRAFNFSPFSVLLLFSQANKENPRKIFFDFFFRCSTSWEKANFLS